MSWGTSLLRIKTRLLRGLLAAPVLTVIGLGPWPLGVGPAPALAATQTTASTASRGLATLSKADIGRYRTLFELIRTGRHGEVDAVLAAVEDPLLVGHVQAARCLDSTRYVASKAELSAWLNRYSELPEAEDIAALAGVRLPIRRIAGLDDGTAAGEGRLDTLPQEPPGRQKAGLRFSVSSLSPAIGAALKRGDERAALTFLRDPAVGGRLALAKQDMIRAEIAFRLFLKGADQQAFDLAKLVAGRSRNLVPMADWTAGLAAWRLGDADSAGRHFAALSESATVSTWVTAAAAFWAARADLVAAKPDRVLDHLTVAARYPQSFYGLMAARLLGRDLSATPEVNAIDAAALKPLLGLAPVRRAMALAAVGELDLASAELGLVRAALSPVETASVDALAARIGLIDTTQAAGKGHFPIPRYRPLNGFRVDRALIFAFVKQESGFDTRAQSPVGARGLMQLMPGTASLVAGRRGIPVRGQGDLTDPSTNLALGQGYLEMLMDDDGVGRNLFLLAAAYNAGPGNVASWLRTANYQGDPLLFIETLPSAETRLFVERILANFWIYQARLGQTLESLDAAASGGWPIFVPQDAEAIQVATQRITAQDYAGN